MFPDSKNYYKEGGMKKMSRKLKRFLSCLMALMMVCSLISYSPATVYAANGSKADASAEAQYGLKSNIQDGVILHCWDWSFNNIKANMAEIAKAGYSAVQTSPIQQAKEGTKGGSNSHWWVLYQPANFSIDNSGNSALGTKAEFQAMVEEAHKYGVKVVVDIVANHTANQTGYDIASNVDPDIKNNASQTYHPEGFKDINYDDRYSITHGSMGGLPDLNTENSIVQGKVLGLLKECIDCGADGFRFDAAKHISVPDEGSQYTFWTNTLVAAQSYAKSTYSKDIYAYGEILYDIGGGVAVTSYTKYMSITDDQTSSTIRGGVKDGNAASAATSYYQKGETPNKAVLWPESHDTYSNDDKATTYIDQQVMDKAWAMEACRANATSLYYVRTPYRSGDFGAVHSYNWKDPEVVAVNKFHNYFAGTSEYLGYEGKIAYNVRNKKGIVLVNCGGSNASVNFSISKTGMADGTYKDQVTGGTFTVSGGNISGQIGNTGVAVVYNADPIVLTPVATISQEGGSFSGDTLSLTIGLQNATSGTYKIGNESAQSFTGSKTITIGSGMNFGDSVTVTLTATDGKNNFNKSYTFTKTEQTGNIAYLKLPSGWGTNVYCYAYDSATETVNNGTWPGAKMTLDSATGMYKYQVPENIQKPRVIFYSDDTHRSPGNMEKGYLFETDGSWVFDGSTWKTYTAPVTKGTVIVKYVDESGVEIANGQTLTGNIGTSYSTSAASVSGYTLKTTPSNASGSYTESTITVTYIYSKVVSTDPLVTSSLASGSSFKTETQTITLSLSNATKGTYSVDDGPVKNFTGSASVVLGQGKVADSTVTVKATATNASGVTRNYTFTYSKVFNGTVVEGSLGATKQYNASGTLASQYKTNPSGAGKKATITIDGDASDWSQDMLIAQGAAWDVANHWKGGHENCVLDTYALYAAWDDTNLYVGWQMVNTTDTWARSGDGPLSDGGRVLDVPLILALSVDPSSPSMSNKNSSGGSIWGQKMGLTFQTHVDRLFYMSGKPGLGKPSMFKAVDSSGNTDYTTGCVGFTEGGIEYKMATTCISSSIIGLNNSNDPNDVFDNSADWVDYKTFTGSSGKHDTTFDSFYEIKIPLATLGTTRSYIESNGIGAMLVATRGESALDCIPFDPSMVDNATGDYTADPSTSAEKDDIDTITVPLAGIGKATTGGGVTPTPDPDPTPTPSELQLNFGADRSAPQSSGTALSLVGIGKGGTAPYTYKFYVNGSQVGTKSGSGETSVSWTPSASGTYKIKCIVTDSAGNSTTSQKNFTVEGGGSVVITEGWQHDSKGYWYQNADGTYPKNAWKQISGKWYYFGADGYMKTGWITVGGYSYYLKSSGEMATDEWVDGGKYYVDASGHWIKGKTKTTEGWKKDSKGYWYQNADGTYPKNAWKKISGKWYYFGADGYMKTGWVTIGNYTYYFKSSGEMAADEWVDNGKYYVDASGHWIKGKTNTGSSGTWKQDSKGWWYQKADGTYPKNQWLQIDGKWYHFNISGYMQTGWYKEGNYSYYLKSNGVMAANEWVDGGKYYVDASGHWVPGKTK